MHDSLRDEHAVELVSVAPRQLPPPWASSTVMASASKPWPATAPCTSCATSSAWGSLPRRCLVAISHAVAALTSTSLASFSMAERALADNRLLPASHQRNACVSSGSLTRLCLPSAPILPLAADRGCRHPRRSGPSSRSSALAKSRVILATMTWVPYPILRLPSQEIKHVRLGPLSRLPTLLGQVQHSRSHGHIAPERFLIDHVRV